MTSSIYMKILLSMFITLVTVSCADPFIYYRNGVPPNEYRDDVADCNRRVTRIADLVSNGNVLYRLFNHCMSESGYTLTDPKTARPWNRRDVERRLAE